MLPSNVGATVSRFEALGEDVAAGRSAISASHNWVADADAGAGAADHHHAAAAKE